MTAISIGVNVVEGPVGIHPAKIYTVKIHLHQVPPYVLVFGCFRI